MIGQFLAFWFFLGPVFGLPLLAIGIILRLCESRWGKVRDGLGSIWYLTGGVFLSVPFAVFYFTR